MSLLELYMMRRSINQLMNRGARLSIYIKLTRICEETNMSLALPIVVHGQ